MKQYRLAKCLGEENVTRALQEIPGDGEPEWELHSIVPSGVTRVENPLHPKGNLAMMAFLVVFEREVHDA